MYLSIETLLLLLLSLSQVQLLGCCPVIYAASQLISLLIRNVNAVGVGYVVMTTRMGPIWVVLCWNQGLDQNLDKVLHIFTGGR
jgi:hypothetical protein